MGSIPGQCITVFFVLDYADGSEGKESASNTGDLGWEIPLEKEMATHSSILAWSNPMDRGMLQSKGWPKVQKDCTTNIYLLYILKRKDSRFLKGQEGPLPEGKAVPWPWKTGSTEVSFERDAKGKEQS